MCVRERERERESVCVCVCVCVHIQMCVCLSLIIDIITRFIALTKSDCFPSNILTLNTAHSVCYDHVATAIVSVVFTSTHCSTLCIAISF